MDPTISPFHRLFIGLPITALGVAEGLREHPLLQDLIVRWVRDEDLHITLIPPWNTGRIESAQEKLSLMRKIPAFPLFFHTIETVPRGEPKILWARSDPAIEILTIKQDLEAIYHQYPDHRPFLPHVILAHFIHGRQSNITNPIAEPFAWSVIVDQVCLYESHQTPQGAWYEKIMVSSLKL